ncbi:MAG: hypothetical protein AAFV07_17700, partial [Bacteroidota bacterium]
TDLPESSAMVQVNNSWWLLNDSGDGPYLYEVHPETGELQRKITITQADNVDWESMTQDSSYIYIGDTGNNKGKRQDLRLFRISKADLDSTLTKIPAQTIAYHYPEQQHFDGRPHPFDCEGIVTDSSFIYLFTKNRNNSNSYLYRIPNQPGEYAAERIDSFAVQGMITDAIWDAKAGRLSLLGYNIEDAFFPFIWEWEGLEHPGFPPNGKRRDLYPEIQAEAMTILNDSALLINSEAGTASRHQLFTWRRRQ